MYPRSNTKSSTNFSLKKQRNLNQKQLSKAVTYKPYNFHAIDFLDIKQIPLAWISQKHIFSDAFLSETNDGVWWFYSAEIPSIELKPLWTQLDAEHIIELDKALRKYNK